VCILPMAFRPLPTGRNWLLYNLTIRSLLGHCFYALGWGLVFRLFKFHGNIFFLQNFLWLPELNLPQNRNTRKQFTLPIFCYIFPPTGELARTNFSGLFPLPVTAPMLVMATSILFRVFVRQLQSHSPGSQVHQVNVVNSRTAGVVLLGGRSDQGLGSTPTPNMCTSLLPQLTHGREFPEVKWVN